MTGQKIKKPTRLTTNNWEISIAKNIDQIEAIRPIWEKMQKSEISPKPNADIDRYISTITSTEQKIEPYVILLHNNNQPQAMLIGRIENIQMSCRLGYKTLINPSIRSIVVVYGGIMGQPDEDVSVLLIRELMKLLRQREVEVIFFNHLRTDSVFYHQVRKIPNILCRTIFPLIEPHWQTRLPDSKDAFFTGTRRRYLKRYMKELKETCGEPIEIVCYNSPQDIPRILSEASAISRLTYKFAMGAGFKDDLRTRSILELAAHQHRLRAYVLYAQHKPVAFEFGIEYGRVFFPEHIGYEPHLRLCSPGTILFLKVLEDLMENTTLRIFDYGFGDAVYKERFGTDFWPEGSVHIVAPRLYPILLNLALTSTSAASGALNYLVTKAGVYNWVKRHWRALLRKRAAPADNQEVN